MGISVLVTGASGAVGPRVVQALHDSGHRVRTLSRDEAVPSLFPDGVETRVGDVTDPEAVRAALDDVEAVVHLAALLHITDLPPGVAAEYERVNVGGTATVVGEAVRAGVTRVVLFSTIAVYGPTYGKLVTEDTPPHPTTPYAQTKLRAEQIVLQEHTSGGRAMGAVLRLAAVYGPRIRGNYRRLLQALGRRRFVSVGRGLNRRTLVYDRDVARAAVLAVERPSAAGRVYNVTDGRPHTLMEITDAMCDALGRRPPRLVLPAVPLRLGAAMVEVLTGLVGLRSPIRRSTIEKLTEDVAVESRRIGLELGYEPLYDLATGWRETVAQMRADGAL